MTKKIAFLFPGQGSQSVGMLSGFSTESIIQQTFQEASEILSYDLWVLIQHDPEGKLNQTEITQPALLTASVALWRLWRERDGMMPLVLAGHSLGEYSALVCSEALSFREAVKLVAMRGKFMQEAVPQGLGAMAAVIGLSPEQIDNICQHAAQGEIVSAANLNAPGQIVIAGNNSAVERAMEMAKESDARLVKKLEVSVPSHCALMMSASEKLNIILENINIKSPKIPVIHNTDANIHQDISKIKQALSRQLYSPVRWVESIQNILKDHKDDQDHQIGLMIECGPGKILAGLNKRIGNIQTLSLSEPLLFEEALKTCST
jgi:[acyl-carrier-protein] S-malonyltransferase